MSMHFPTSIFEDWQARCTEFCQSGSSRPFVTLSFAQSLDGCLAQHPGHPTGLSDKESWVVTHRLRSLHDGILVGRGTVLSDDPQLNVRFYDGPSPRPVILDTHGECPNDARIFQMQAERTILATACAQDLTGRFPGVQTLQLAKKDNRIDLPALLEALYEKGIRSLMVEGGGQVLSSFLAEGLCDFLIVTISTRIIGNDDSVRYKLSPNQTLRFAESKSAQHGQDIWVWGQLKQDYLSDRVPRKEQVLWPSASRS